MKHRFVLWLVSVVLTVGMAHSVAAQPRGDVVYALHVTIAPSWFDPAEAPAQITPYVILYTSPFAPSISNCLNFKLPIESSIQSQPLQDVLL